MATGVVHQNVDVRKLPGEPGHVGAVGEISRHGFDRHIGLARNRFFGPCEIAGGARDQHEMTPFRRQLSGGRAADSLRGAGYQGSLTGELEIHGHVLEGPNYDDTATRTWIALDNLQGLAR